MRAAAAGTAAALVLTLGACAATPPSQGRDPTDRNATVPPGTATTPAAVDPAARRLVALLRRGGEVVYVRHAATDDALDQAVDFEDCSTQRNLSTAGRDQARLLGRAVRQAGIPVGPVLASPYCRTVHTAELAFGRARVDRRLAAVQPAGPGRARVRVLRRLLSAPVRDGNRVLVGHTANIERAAGVLLPEGGAAVFSPHGDGFQLRGTLTPGDFAALAAAG